MKWSIISTAYLCYGYLCNLLHSCLSLDQWYQSGFNFSFKFCSNIQQTSSMCYNLHRALSWVKQEEFFFFHFFCRDFFGRRLCRSDLKHLVQNLQKQIPDLDSSRKITQFQKKWVKSEFGCGKYRWFKISYFIRIFVTVELLQCESEISECLDRDFQLMGRCKMILLLLKTGYNKYSELYWPIYVHFNFGAAFGVGFHWRRALPPHFSRHLLHIHQFQHSIIRLGLFGDMPSHPRLCRHLLLHQQPT